METDYISCFSYCICLRHDNEMKGLLVLYTKASMPPWGNFTTRIIKIRKVFLSWKYQYALTRKIAHEPVQVKG